MSETQTLASAASPPLRLFPYLTWVATVLLTLGMFHETATAMVGIWWRSETYTHAFLVLPISAWLIWRRRNLLPGLVVRAEARWLIPIALAGLLWLMGELASVSAASQFALVAILVLTVPAVLGWQVAKCYLFPLLFLFFSVPIGEFLTEPMIAATADFTVAALSFTGIPVYREGMQFVIPSGNWSVVEACSGVRYLIASFMVGTLFAYLNYSSWRRRLAFIALSIAVPVVANWLRAYMIVMLGHLSGNKLAVGADHLVYGWVFFGIVIGLMFWIGAQFSEPERPSEQSAAAANAGGAAKVNPKPLIVALSALMLLWGGHLFMWQLEHAPLSSEPVIALPESLSGGWVADVKPLSTWTPRYHQPSATVSRTYRAEGESVAVWIAFYRQQGKDRKLVSSSNQLVDPERSVWLPVARSTRVLDVDGAKQPMRSANLRTPADPGTEPTQRLNVLYAYRVAGQLTVSDARAKLRLALDRLLGRDDDSAVIFFISEGDGSDASWLRLDRFVGLHAARLAAVVDAVAPLR